MVVGAAGDAAEATGWEFAEADEFHSPDKVAKMAAGTPLTDEDRFRGEIIERLMCELSVDLAAVCERHGRSPDELARPLAAIAPLLGDGLVTLTDERLTITPAGRPVVRSVCAAFDAYLDEAAGRHAKAI